MPRNRGRTPNGRRQRGRRTHGKGMRSERLLEQPVANPTGGVPCEICGHPIDPNRLHFHMVRVHGVAFKAKGT